MVVGRIEHGHIQLAAALPVEWEGQTVKIEPCTPDDVLPDLEGQLAALHALGPMEFEHDERKANEREIATMNELSRIQMQHLSDGLP
jgi:hypothetical protein